MFWRTKNAGGSDFHESSLNEQSESFLRHHDPRLALRLPPSTNVLWPWVLSTSFFAILSLALLTFQVVPSRTGSYEVGFDTELEPAKVAIAIEKVKFHGGIIVNETGHFNLISDPHGPKYTGHPTRELDAAWDSLVGYYIALSEAEASRIQGVEIEGPFLVVPHVRHSLHCVNYLRKALYTKYYPVVHEMRENIPDYWMHVDHCIDTLRETLQCNMDLTPVPHVWSESKGMYLADTQLVHTCRDFGQLLDWQNTRETTLTTGTSLHK